MILCLSLLEDHFSCFLHMYVDKAAVTDCSHDLFRFIDLSMKQNNKTYFSSNCHVLFGKESKYQKPSIIQLIIIHNEEKQQIFSFKELKIFKYYSQSFWDSSMIRIMISLFFCQFSKSSNIFSVFGCSDESIDRKLFCSCFDDWLIKKLQNVTSQKWQVAVFLF